MDKIAIIGGSGFVGSRLTDILVNEFCVSNFDKNPSNFYQNLTTIGDVRNLTDLVGALKDCKIVVLLAAEHRDDVRPTQLYYDVNVDGMKNVLQAMDLNGICRIIFTSSVAVYGLNKDNPSEDFVVDPFNHYGKSKYLAELELRNWYKKDTSNRNVVIIRPTVIFGERNRGNVFNLLKQISSGLFIMTGSGSNKKSMAYVGNVTAFIHFCLSNYNRGFEIINYIDKPDFTMNDLVKQVEDSLKLRIPSIHIPYWLGLIVGGLFDLLSLISGKRFSISKIRIKKFCATTQYDSYKAMNSGFVPPFSLNEGLDRTLKFEFLEKNMDNYVFHSE